MAEGTSPSTSVGLNGDPKCACGHVYDEHDDGQECTVEFYDPYHDLFELCGCVHWDEMPADD